MKKLFSTLFFTLAALSLWAGNGMGPVAVAIIQNDAATYSNYRLSSTNWPGNALSSEINDRPLFHAQDLGECTSLLIDGAAIVAWAEGNDYYTNETFRLHYRVYDAAGTPGAWSAEMPIDFLALREGNNYRYHVTGKAIDVLALAGYAPGTYKLDVQFLAKKFWSDGTNGGFWHADGDVCTAMFTIPSSEGLTPTIERSFYFDFGCKADANRSNAAIVANPDGNGNYWNNITSNSTSPYKVNASDNYTLVQSDNTASTIHLGFAGDMFIGNGAGGLATPDATVLGDLAVVNATRDYLFASNAENCKMVLTGLDVNKAYQFKIFGSRNATDVRVPKYTLEGFTKESGTLQVSGSNYGGSGINQNVANVYTTGYLFPDATGKITITVNEGVNKSSNRYYPINCMRMQEFTGVTRPAVTKYSSLFMKSATAEDASVAMHLLGNPEATEGTLFEAVAQFGAAGTVSFEDAEGNELASLAAPENGVYRVTFDAYTRLMNTLKIEHVNLTGNMAQGGWSTSGPELTYQGHGVWQKTFTDAELPAYSGSDAERGSFCINNGWSYNIKMLANNEGKAAFADKAATAGYEVADIPMRHGKKIITLNLRDYTYAFDCIDEDETKITFFGSSVCNGQGATDMHGYAYQYMQTQPDFTYSNAAINGNNTKNLLSRYKGHLLADCGKYVVIGLGLGNEGLHEAANKQAVYDQWKHNMDSLITIFEEAGKVVVATNNYPRGDYNASDYNYVKRMNLEMHEWDIPTVNFLGALDNCADNGQWATGYQVSGDIYHPTTQGHTEFMHTIVPSLFTALAANKPMPARQATSGTALTAAQHISFTPEGQVHPFAVALRVKANAVCSAMKLTMDGEEVAVNLPESAADGQWHTMVISHYHAAAKTIGYIDGTVFVTNNSDNALLTTVTIGGAAMEVSDLMFWRSALNADEVAALGQDKLLCSSLELYCPLNNAQVDNLAQSTNSITLSNETTGLSELNLIECEQRFDVLGRPVNKDYHGIVISKQGKTLQF